MFGLGGGTEYSLTLTETDDISTGMFMVYGSHRYLENFEFDVVQKSLILRQFGGFESCYTLSLLEFSYLQTNQRLFI